MLTVHDLGLPVSRGILEEISVPDCLNYDILAVVIRVFQVKTAYSILSYLRY